MSITGAIKVIIPKNPSLRTSHIIIANGINAAFILSQFLVMASPIEINKVATKSPIEIITSESLNTSPIVLSITVTIGTIARTIVPKTLANPRIKAVKNSVSFSPKSLVINRSNSLAKVSKTCVNPSNILVNIPPSPIISPDVK